MMALLVIAAFIVYLLISIWVVMTVLSWASKNKRSGWWGFLAAFVMYNLVFWDWIPTKVAHKHYCETQAGITINKTPEQWRKENPDVRLIQSSKREYQGEHNDYISTEAINQRFNYVTSMNPINSFLPIYKSEARLEDVMTKQVLIQRKNYLTGYRNKKGSRSIRLWINAGSCDEKNTALLAFGELEEKYRKLDNGE